MHFEEQTEETLERKADVDGDETTGDEEFFLVKYWASTETQMVALMNQRPIATTTTAANTSTFSLQSMNLDRSDPFGAKEWKLFRERMKRARDWKLYNFDQNRSKRQAQIQKKKLRLLMRICGGFTSSDPDQQDAQL